MRGYHCKKCGKPAPDGYKFEDDRCSDCQRPNLEPEALEEPGEKPEPVLEGLEPAS
jgi:hypothetical protein